MLALTTRKIKTQSLSIKKRYRAPMSALSLGLDSRIKASKQAFIYWLGYLQTPRHLCFLWPIMETGQDYLYTRGLAMTKSADYFPLNRIQEIEDEPGDFRLLERVPLTKSSAEFPLSISPEVGDEKTIIFLDTETTGLSWKNDKVCR